MTTAIEKPKTRIEQVRTTMEVRKDAILSMLPSTIGKERFMAISLAIVANPEIAECTQQSIVDCIYGCAKLGLVPDKTLGHIYIIPRNINLAKKGETPRWERQATLMPGFRGLIELGRRSGALGLVHTGIVYQGETYRHWVDETGPRFLHEPNIEGKDGRVPIAAYCIYDMRAMGRGVEVLPWSKVLKSMNSKDAGPVWKYGHLSEMARKTAVRMASKYWPLTPELGAAVQWDEEAEREEQQTITTDAESILPPDAPRKRSLIAPEVPPATEPTNGPSGEPTPQIDPGEPTYEDLAAEADYRAATEDGPTDQQLAEEAAKRQQGAKSGVIEPMFPDAPNENRLRR